VIPWEFLLLFSQGYDSAGFTAPAFAAAIIKGVGPHDDPVDSGDAQFEHVLF
jgi:hypothetical protein